MDEDATGKERVAHLVRRKAPLRRENSESTSDASRKMTHLALRGRLMSRRREGRPPLPVSAPGRQATEKEIFQVKIFPFPLPNTSPMLDSHNMTSSNSSSLGQGKSKNLT